MRPRRRLRARAANRARFWLGFWVRSPDELYMFMKPSGVGTITVVVLVLVVVTVAVVATVAVLVVVVVVKTVVVELNMPVIVESVEVTVV